MMLLCFSVLTSPLHPSSFCSFIHASLLATPASYIPLKLLFLSLAFFIVFSISFSLIYLPLTFNAGLFFFLPGHALSTSLQSRSLVLLTDYSTAECEIVTSQCGPLTITDCLLKIMSTSPSTYPHSCPPDVFNQPNVKHTHTRRHADLYTHTHTHNQSLCHGSFYCCWDSS